jgi:O-antigen/teichoic acid export membrane protein
MVVAMVLEHRSRDLDFVMALWTTAGVLAALLGIWRLRKLKTSGWTIPVDWVWVKKGVLVSLTFSLGTVALRGVLTFDRYWLERLVGIDTVGAYILLLGIASTLIIFLDSTLFSFSYPDLIKFHHEGKNHEARTAVYRLFLQAIALSLLFGLISWLLLPFILMWIGNPIYINYINLYPWLLSAMILNALSMVPHYALYARGIDKPLIYSHVVSIFVFTGVTWFVGITNPLLAVPVGLNSAFAAILVWKFIAYITFLNKS